MRRLLIASVFAAFVLPLEAGASVFGQCAQQGEPELKIRACKEASRSTPYPWILHWVHRELARAHRERGEIEPALANYAHALAAREHEGVRREMEALAHASVVSPSLALAEPAVGPDPQH